MSRRLTISVLVILLVSLAGCMSMISDSEPVDAVPADSDVVMYGDFVGLAQDETTEELADEVAIELLGEDEEFYEEAYTEFEEEVNTELAEEFDDSVTVDSLTGVYVFGEFSDGEEEVGAIVDTALDDEQISTFSADEAYEYEGYPVFTPDDEDLFVTVIDSENGLFAVAETESYLEKILDTHRGELPQFDSELNEDAYVSAIITEIEGWEQFQAEQSELTGEDELPEPEEIQVSYSADGTEMMLEASAVFETQDAVSEWERLLEEDDSDLDVSITRDGTTVTSQVTATPATVVESIDDLLSQFEDTAQSTEPIQRSGEVSVSEVSDDTAEILVTQLEENHELIVEVSSVTNSEYTISDNTPSDWSVADSEGQVVEVSELEEGDVIVVGVADSEEAVPTRIEVIDWEP